MEDKIKSAFDQIHAENELKDKTKDYLAKKLYHKKETNTARFRKVPALVACSFILLVGIFGYFSYSTPVAAISLDINPSVELEVNMYDRIINTTGYNDDGVLLADSLDIKNMNYEKAVDAVIESDYVTESLEKGNTLEVTVACSSEKRSSEIKDCLENKNNISSNCIYDCSNREDVETAHSLGLSFGKYHAYLELQAVDPDITPEDVKDLTMKEIRDMISDCSDTSQEGQQNGNGNQNGKGNGNDSGNGNGNGSGNANGSGNGNGSGDGSGYQNGKHNGNGNGKNNKN